MTTIFMQHTVEDYDTWNAGFDAHATTRKEFGSPEAEWESAEAFQRFMEESDVKEKMGELGVISEPEVTLLEEIEAKIAEHPGASRR